MGPCPTTRHPPHRTPLTLGIVDGLAQLSSGTRPAPAPHDKRAVRVSLTPEGQELAREAAVEADRRIQALTAHLTDAQRSQLSLLASALVSGRTTL